ncbi:hypothetical protein JW898_01565 [Candidatus Woesearchaeota archaeon]|nr:hypothetical protein [Candidatus Woesearchaeota archaeon]
MAASEKLKKFSKTTLGTTVETVSDYVDILSQIMVEYVNQKYKVKQKVDDVKRATMTTLYSLKRGFIRTMVESFFILTALLALVVGVVLLLNKVMPLEYIFLGYGLLVGAAVVFSMKLKP